MQKGFLPFDLVQSWLSIETKVGLIKQYQC